MQEAVYRAADQGDPVRLLQQGAVAPLVLWIPAGFLPGTGEDSAQGNGLAAVPPVQHQAGGQHIHPQRPTGKEQPGAVLYRLADGLVQRCCQRRKAVGSCRHPEGRRSGRCPAKQQVLSREMEGFRSRSI